MASKILSNAGTMMHEAVVKKQKIELEDYNFERDRFLRLYLSKISIETKEVLEEIIQSSLQFSLKEFSSGFNKTTEHLLPLFQEFETIKLLVVSGDLVQVNKEMRKYFEHSLELFEEGFSPDMIFLYQNLKKVPIHCLPLWYLLSKTSNNLFLSLIEKYLMTPHIYERYLQEMSEEAIVLQAKEIIYRSKELSLSVTSLQKELHLNDKEMEKVLILLEFLLVGGVHFVQQENTYKRYFSMFQEYRTYRLEQKRRQLHRLPLKEVTPLRRLPFAFLQDLQILCSLSEEEKIVLQKNLLPTSIIDDLVHRCKLQSMQTTETLSYCNHLLSKGLQLSLLSVHKQQLVVLEEYFAWKALPIEEQSLYLLRHENNKPLSYKGDPSLICAKNIKSAQKAIVHAIGHGWVKLENLLDAVTVPLHSQEEICLQKVGVRYLYQLPSYNSDEKELLQSIFLDTLFTSGLVEKGDWNGVCCIRVTAFGSSLYGN